MRQTCSVGSAGSSACDNIIPVFLCFIHAGFFIFLHASSLFFNTVNKKRILTKRNASPKSFAVGFSFLRYLAGLLTYGFIFDTQGLPFNPSQKWPALTCSCVSSRLQRWVRHGFTPCSEMLKPTTLYHINQNLSNKFC